jgi:hypothetical protein
MAERASVFQQVQIGVESTSGTPVAANKLLQSMGLIPTAAIDVDVYRPDGLKYPTVAVSGRDQVTARVTGKPTYTELVYPLSGLLGAATITGPNGDGAYTWVFAPASAAADAFKTFTVQRGSAVAAEQWAFGLFAAFGLTFDRRTTDLTGAMIGQALSSGITLTASPSAIPLIPISPKEISVFIDTTSAGLGTTKLTKLLRGTLGFGANKYNPLWVVDSAQASFVSVVEAVPQAQLSLLLEADTQGLSFLANVRAGDTRFVRLLATGPLIAGASNNKLTWDMAVKFGSPREFSDQDGVYALEYPLSIVHDATWGKAMTATLINAVATL